MIEENKEEINNAFNNLEISEKVPPNIGAPLIIETKPKLTVTAQKSHAFANKINALMPVNFLVCGLILSLSAVAKPALTQTDFFKGAVVTCFASAASLASNTNKEET